MKLLVAVMTLVACGATRGGVNFDLTPAAPTQEVTPTKPSTPEIGVISMISDASGSLQLSTEQNGRVLALIHDLEQQHTRVEELRKRLSLDIAASVEAGAIDDKGLRSDADALGRARADVAPGDAKALEELHQILTPEQRKQFAAGLDALADKLRNDDAQKRYSNWRSDLDLTVIQNEKIEGKLDADGSLAASARGEQEAWRKRLHGTASAFVADAYGAGAYADPDVVTTTIERVRRLAVFLNVVVPVLTPDQRKVAAANLRAEVGVQ